MTDVPSFQLIQTLLDYSPSTGVFIWKDRGRGVPFKRSIIGKEAGSAHSSGYWSISVNGTKYLAHHLAWLYSYKSWPTSFIDHINLNKRDNRIENLRLASPAQNSANASLRIDNTSGYRGVTFEPRRKKWIAILGHEGKRKQLGSFSTPEEAAAAYARGAATAFGEFCPGYVLGAAP